jgi:DNA invertase Pin-like site-specific DNA recombinase
MKYGYARVSTDGHSVNAQVRQFTRAGCKTVLREAARGANTARSQLRRVLDKLAAGDPRRRKGKAVLMVTRLDRLARSALDLLDIRAAIADKRAGVRSLGDAWADTTTAHGRGMLTVLPGLTAFECELIRARITKGHARAKARGLKLGRLPKLTPQQQRAAIKRPDRGETVRDIALLYHVNASTISRLTA